MNHEEKAGREVLVNMINDGESYPKILGALTELGMTYGNPIIKKVFVAVNAAVRAVCIGD